MQKFDLNENREILVISLWIYPLIPMIMFIIFGFYLVIIAFIVWFILFGIIYYYFHAELLVCGDKLVIKRIKNEYIIKYEEILIINEIKTINNKWTTTKYKIIIKESKNIIPKRFLTIENNKFSLIYKSLNLNTNVVYKI